MTAVLKSCGCGALDFVVNNSSVITNNGSLVLHNLANQGTLNATTAGITKIVNSANLAGGGLTGGTWNVFGALQFNGNNIFTNAASRRFCWWAEARLEPLLSSGPAHLSQKTQTSIRSFETRSVRQKYNHPLSRSD